MNMLIKKKALIALVVILLGASIWKPIFGWHQPYINWAPWDLAAHLAEKGRPAKECLDLIYFEIMSPSQSEQRALCIHEYAKLTKNPSACELLMPSSYGLSCVGAATINLPCRFDDEKNVIWNDGEYQEVPFDSCSTESSPLGQQCCIAAQSKFSPAFTNGCEALRGENGLLADQCEFEVGRKFLDLTYCEKIQSENVRAACELNVGTLRDNADLRSAYPFINVRDLK